MRVLVTGGGGREHALVWKLSQSSKVSKIFCAPGNAGTGIIATNVYIKATNIDGLKEFALKEKIDLTIVGPEDPLVGGIVDEFTSVGLRIFGPTKSAAVLEGSKVFMKDLCAKYDIPTASYKVFEDHESAKKYLNSHKLPIVIKADGLAAGKGVTVCHTLEKALNALKEIFEDRKFGDAGNKVVIEKCLEGEEASYIVLVDKNGNFIPLASSQDHKARDTGDKGPNTGGMGAYSPAPVITVEVERLILGKIIHPTLVAMRKEDRPFSGILYAGLMIKGGKPYVLEFNVRLGDPETQPILARMKSDIVPVILAALDGKLDSVEIEWDERPAVCVVMASKGYPYGYKKGFEIFGIDEAEKSGAIVFHAGTQKGCHGAIETSGGRVLGITAKGNTFREAKNNAYRGVEKIRYDNLFWRNDIADRAINRR